MLITAYEVHVKAAHHRSERPRHRPVPHESTEQSPGTTAGTGIELQVMLGTTSVKVTSWLGDIHAAGHITAQTRFPLACKYLCDGLSVASEHKFYVS